MPWMGRAPPRIKFESLQLFIFLIKILDECHPASQTVPPSACHARRRSTLLYVVPSLIYLFQNNVTFHTLRYVDAPTYQILGNLKIATTGLFTWFAPTHGIPAPASLPAQGLAHTKTARARYCQDHPGPEAHSAAVHRTGAAAGGRHHEPGRVRLPRRRRCARRGGSATPRWGAVLSAVARLRTGGAQRMALGRGAPAADPSKRRGRGAVGCAAGCWNPECGAEVASALAPRLRLRLAAAPHALRRSPCGPPVSGPQAWLACTRSC